MAPSIRHRLAHPVTAIEQGLPSSRLQSRFREGEVSRRISDHTREVMEVYLESIPDVDRNRHEHQQQEHLYGNLNIIDSKAQSLLSFNSFLLAIIGIYFGTVQSVRSQIWLLIPFLVTVVASGLACLLCLDVVWIHWLTASDLESAADAAG
jgi:hypothetical protein